MCGLIALLATGGGARGHRKSIEAALPCMAHRGPDARASWHDQHVVLGFHRLAVVDLEHSHQPMISGPMPTTDRYAVVFNGEIYNHLELRAELSSAFGVRFVTQGDTEVIAAAYHHWGLRAVERFRGMFAFVIWDRSTQTMIAARDPFGIKPLYVASGPGGVAFASEKKALLGLGRVLEVDLSRLDGAATQQYLTFQYVPEPASMHQHVRRVESGTVAVATPDGGLHSRRYFQPILSRGGSGRTVDSESRIAAALRDSVAVHMRADVPVGAFLSGGIDSTAIAALARGHNPNLTTFTAAFERPGYSEADVAAQTAAALGVRHVVRTISAAEVIEALPRIVWYLDDPVADPALVPLWFVAREARRHVKVVLSGEGADELFGGYRIYREPSSLAHFERLPTAVRTALGRLATRLPSGMRGTGLLRRGSVPLEQRYYGNARVFRPEQLARMLHHHDPAAGPERVTAPFYRQSAGWDPVARMQHIDLFTWLRGDILVKADKMTMANSLELRVPFLDPHVFAVAAGLGPADKINHGTTKYALRQAMIGIVPPHVLDRPKLGFPVPVREWFRAELAEWAATVVDESGAGQIVDLAHVGALLREHRNGAADHGRQLWSVLIFLLWHGIFVEQRIRPWGDAGPAAGLRTDGPTAGPVAGLPHRAIRTQAFPPHSAPANAGRVDAEYRAGPRSLPLREVGPNAPSAGFGRRGLGS